MKKHFCVLLFFGVFSCFSNEYICGKNSRVVLSEDKKSARIVGNIIVLDDVTVKYGTTRLSGVGFHEDSFNIDPNEKEYFIFILPNEKNALTARLVSSKINFSSDTLIWASNNICRLTSH